MTKRRYYAERKPRGFSNETVVYSFPDKEMRRKYLEDKDMGGDPTEPYAVSSKTAKKTMHYRGDSATESYNSSEPREFVKYQAKDRNHCEFNGGEWVKSYRKKDGTHVEGYCRTVRGY